jgi:hypothetical protein
MEAPVALIPLADGLRELLVLVVGEDRHFKLTFARQDCMIPTGAAGIASGLLGNVFEREF